MKTSFRFPALLTAFGSLLLSGFSVAADEAREIEFRVLCLEHLDDVKMGELASGDGGKKLEVPLAVGGFSKQFKTSFAGETVTLSINDKKAPKGRRVIASGVLSKSNQQVFLFVPNPDEDMVYRIFSMDDDEKSVPMGSVSVLNLSGSPIRINRDGKGLDGEEMKSIEDGELASYPPVNDADDWGMYQVSLEIGTPDGKWYPFVRPSWKRSELKRDLIVITFDERVQQPRVITYKDIPPWRESQFGRLTIPEGFRFGMHGDMKKGMAGIHEETARLIERLVRRRSVGMRRGFFVSMLAACGMTGWLAAEPVKVLVWNTERGSNPYGPTGKQRVIKVIRDSGADVVLWQESYKLEGSEETLGAWVSKQMGWSIWQGDSPHLAVASRFEQVDRDFHHPWHGLAARLRDDEGREFIAWSIWLDYRADVQSAALAEPRPTDEALIACDITGSDRFRQAQQLLDGLDQRGNLAEQVPVLVGGDWNCSSHLDWTEAAAKVFPHRRPLALPISRLMHAAGFADAFRVVHPNAAAVPGNTWTPRGGIKEDGSPDPPERIDRLYLRNPLGRAGLVPVRTTVYPLDPADARMPREQAVFPSDHAAVLIEFEWRETTSSTPGAFLPEPAAASPGIDHDPPAAEEPGFAPTRIAWGSCFREDNPCPMLDQLAAQNPELYLALGDNIYGDTPDMGVLRGKYRRLARQPGWRALTRTARVMATWDDHDYGADDSGREFAPRDASKEIFLDFFDEPALSPRRSHAGIYTSALLGPEEKRIQILMLDLRSFRSPLARAEKKAYPELGGYRPLRDDEPQVMLGEEQWQWLEEELKKPARLRLIGLSTQLGAAHGGYEAWANLPKERERFFKLLESTRAEGVVLLSGDTHWAEASLVERPGLYPIHDLTSSSLNQVWDPAGPNVNRIGPAYTKANAGLIEIDWENERIETRMIDEQGRSRIALAIPLSELRFNGEVKDRIETSGVWRSSFGELRMGREGAVWRGTYPKGSCELVEKEGALEGTWSEGQNGGRCRFLPSRCGRFLRGAYGRGNGPMSLPWPAWRAEAEGAEFLE